MRHQRGKWFTGEYGLWWTLSAQGKWNPDEALKISRYHPGLKDVIEAPEKHSKMTRRGQRAMRQTWHAAGYRYWTEEAAEAENGAQVH